MPSGLTSRFYLAGIAPGLTFEITSITPVSPDGYDWKAEFRRAAGGASIGCVGQTVYNNWDMPYQVSMSDQDGFIGEAHFEGHNGLWSSGTGAKVTVEFRVYGTTTIDGADYTIDKSMVVPITTTDWGGFTRPDYVNVTYSWREGTTDPVNVSLAVPADMAGMPADLYFIPGVRSENGGEVGMDTSTDKAVALTAVDYVLQGIFWAHKELFGWATGEILPLPF